MYYAYRGVEYSYIAVLFCFLIRNHANYIMNLSIWLLMHIYKFINIYIYIYVYVSFTSSYDEKLSPLLLRSSKLVPVKWYNSTIALILLKVATIDKCGRTFNCVISQCNSKCILSQMAHLISSFFLTVVYEILSNFR